MLAVYYQNCRGLKTKLHTLYMNVLANTYDVIILTETWLHGDISDSEFIDTRYRVFRCDRDRAGSGRCDGGGVLVAVHRAIAAAPCARAAAVSSSRSPLVDHVIVELRSRDYCCVLSAAYIPPNLRSDVYIPHFDVISRVMQDTDVNDFIIAGDYNLPTLEWRDCGTYLEPIINSSYCSANKHLINLISSLNGYQINTHKNVKNRILDPFITNILDSTTAIVSPPLVPPDENHPPFYGLLPINKTNLSHITKKPSIQFNYFKADYENINIDVSKINWENLFSNMNAEGAVSLFYEKI